MKDIKIIVLTPVKNESWILEKFLMATSIWADLIIVADQSSTDGSQDIAKRFEKVKLIKNESPEFNEPERQKLLLSEARKVPGKKLIFALDADEFLSANAFETNEWNMMLDSPAGTVFKFKWPFISPDFKHYWSGKDAVMPFAFVDDGRNHSGPKIHSVRIPMGFDSQIKEIHDFVVMHYQFTDWKRMESKHRWYQCYERINFPNKSAVQIFRTYTHMHRIKKSDYKIIPASWFEGYINKNIDVMSVNIQDKYWWDEQVENMVAQYGKEKFINIDLPENKSLLLSYLSMTKKIGDWLPLKVIDRFFWLIK